MGPTSSHGTRFLTSELELKVTDFASGSGVLPNTENVSPTVPKDGEVELTSTFPILGTLKLVFNFPTFGTKTSMARSPLDGEPNTRPRLSLFGNTEPSTDGSGSRRPLS